MLFNEAHGTDTKSVSRPISWYSLGLARSFQQYQQPWYPQMI